jgi:transcriptional regulator with XRE-family HTH domain
MPHDDLEETLGRNVRTLRIARQLTQSEVARRANISLGAVQHLERGEGATISTLVKILRALGAESWLDTLAPAPPTFSPLDLLAASKAADRTRRRGPPRVPRRRS